MSAPASDASPRHTLLAGLGSPHGDDEVGWVITDRLAKRILGQKLRSSPTLRRLPPLAAELRDGQRWSIQKLAVPAGMLDLLEPTTETDRVTDLFLIDACLAEQPPGTVLRWVWPNRHWETRRSSSTHELSLPWALQMAEHLGRLPPRVSVLGIVVPPPTFPSPTIPGFPPLPGAPSPFDSGLDPSHPVAPNFGLSLNFAAKVPEIVDRVERIVRGESDTARRRPGVL